jgi:hypothetical protein
VIAPMMFLTSLLHSLGTRRVESLADLHRDFNADHGTTVNYKPYYERLDTPGFVEFMRSTFESMMTSMFFDVLEPLKDSPFGRFDDIVIHDGSSFAVHDDLASIFPGRFKTVSPAAVELHTTMSLFHDNFVSATLTPDSECERHHVPDAKELRNKLFLADRGFDGRPMMTEIDQNGGHFLIRVRDNLNPFVGKIARRGERYRKLVGKRLDAVLRRAPKGKTLDMDVHWLNQSDEVQYRFRLITFYSGPDKGWMRLMTNLPRDEFATDIILTAYRLRWQIELHYKELKSYSNLHAFCTRKSNIAEGLIWASLCVTFLKRYLSHACQQVTGIAISTRRAAMCSHVFLAQFFASVRRSFTALRRVLVDAFEFLSVNAKRSNPSRERKKGRLAGGLSPVVLGSAK